MAKEVYRIINLANDKSYIGITEVGILNRFRGHLKRGKKNNKKNPSALSSAISKYGKENFVIERVDEATSQEQLYLMERYYIKKFRSHISTRDGYNMTWGGDVSPMSIPEIRAKLTGENHPANRPETAHIWREDSASKRPEVRAKISKAGKGKKKPESMCGENHPSKRPEVRELISINKIGKPNPSALKGVEITIDGITYISKKAAKLALGWTDGMMYRYTTRGTTDKKPIICGDLHPCKREDVRKKISKSTKGISKNRGGSNSSAVAVVMDCVVYETKKEAMLALELSEKKLNKMVTLGTCEILDKNIFPLRGN